MSLIKTMEAEGKKLFEAINDKQIEHVGVCIQSAVTYNLRSGEAVDLGLIKFTATKQGSGEAAAIIPSVDLSDNFVSLVSDDDIDFDIDFSRKIKSQIQKAMSSEFKSTLKELLEGKVYNSDKNTLEDISSDAASTHDITDDIMGAMTTMLVAGIIRDLNENKSTEKYTLDVLNILDMSVQVTDSGKVKVNAAPHRALKQLVKND